MTWEEYKNKMQGNIEETPWEKYKREHEEERIRIENENRLKRQEEANKQEDTNKWFKSGAFGDNKGNLFTDTVSSVGSTIGDIGVGIGKGIFRLGEGVGDLVSYGVADIQELTGHKEAAEATRERTKESVTDRIFNPAEEFVDKNSFLGDKSDNITEGLGYVAGMTALGIVTGGAGSTLGMTEATAATLGTTATTFTSAMGSGMSDALNDGATIDEARIYGAISGAGEAVSELMFGGLGKASKALGFSKSALPVDDFITKGLTKNIKNKMVKTVIQSGIKSGAEGLEEVVSGLISAAAKKMSYMSEEDFGKIVKDEKLGEQFWMGTLTSAIAQTPSTIRSVKNGTDYISGRTQNEDKIYNSLMENKTREAKTQKTIDNMINDQSSKLKELYGRELTTEEVNKIKEAVNETYEAGRLDTESTKLDNKEKSKIEEEINKDLEEGNLSLETIRDILGENVDISKDNLLQRSLYENSQKYEDYKVEESDNEKVNILRQSAADAGVNNTTKTRNKIELISKLVENTNRQYRFVNQEQLKEMGYNENANGLNDNGEILLSVNSNKEIVSVVGHETTHLFDSKVEGEYTQEYKDLQSAVKDYLKANGTYESKINQINETYSKAGINLTQEQVIEEVTADTIGDNLFGENAEEFIKQLTSNRNVFQKIYDYIKKTVRNIKGYDSEEAKQLQNLKDAFDKVYKTLDTTEVNTDTKYSIQQNEEGQKYVKVDIDQDIFKNKTIKEQKEVAKKYILDNFRENGLIKDENKINVSRRTANEYTNPKTKIANSNLSDKLKASTELNNLLDISEYKYSSEDDGRHVFAKNGWDYYETIFQVGNKTYTGLLNIAKGDKGKLLYDITKIKERANNISVKTESVVNSSSNNSIPSSNNEVNTTTKYSIQNNENNTQDNKGRTLTKEQQEYFKDSKILDRNGLLLTLYHGTNNEFNVFDNKKVGNNTKNAGFYGDGFYFTPNEDSARQYGKNKKEVYLNIKKPFSFNELSKYNGEDYYTDYVQIMNLTNLNNEWNNIPVNFASKQTWGDISNDVKSMIQQGKTDEEIDNTMYEKYGELPDRINDRLYNYSQKNGYKTLSEVLKEKGYDGIINSDIPGNSSEIVAFESNQIKNIDNTNPTSNPDIRYSLTKGETDQYWKKLDKNDIQEYNTIESEVGNNGEQRFSREDNSTQEETNERVGERPSSNYRDIKEIYENYRNRVKEQRLELSNVVKEQLSQLPLSKTKTEKFIKELTNNEKMTYEDVTAFLRDNNTYTEKEISEELQQIRNDINRYKFKLSDKLKSELRYRYGKIPRNIKLSNEGLAIDQAYQELSSEYPDIFSDKIINEADQAETIIEFMKNANPISTYTAEILSEDEISDIGAIVYGYKGSYDFAKNIIKDNYVKEKEKFKAENLSPENIQTNNTPKKLTRKMVKEQILQEMNITDEDLQSGNDIKSLNFQLTDPVRVNEKVFGKKVGQKINDLTINKTKHNTAEKTRWLNNERADIEELGIKARSKESAAVQKYGEKQYVDKNGDIHEYGDTQLAKEFPNKKAQEKIKKAAEVIRGKYDTYIDQINGVLTALGYDAIPKRQDYMRHFQELGDIFSKTGVPFNLNDMSAENLPTDINGLTEFNKPGKNWFAQAQKRYGEKTTYDAITGIDGYLEGAGNLIFHTQDIQNYRALSSLIRDTFGATKGFEKLDGLTDAEVGQRIKDIEENKLSKYVAWLDEQANSLAGKKGAIDRGTERFLGRKAYTFFNTIKKQVGSNMTGLNVRSSLTNLISSTIAAAKTNKIALVKGTVSTINNMFRNDDFIDKSDFLTSRFGSDSLSSKMWQKVSNAGQIFMTGTDYFTSNIITRSKYYEGLSKGMNESEAIKYADDFAARVMGDRSQGATAEAFNSKTLGLFTQFQLEVNNQWQYMIHDTKMDYQQNSKINGGLKAGATALFQLGQLAAYSYFFNEAFEQLTGSRAAFDPVEILKTLFGIGGEDDKDDEKTFDQRLSEAGAMLVDNIPFGNLITGGGRIPISEALTGIGTLGKKLTNQKDKYGNEITWEDVGKDTLKALPYWVLPTGYSQANKIVKGLGMYNDNLPVAGSYTDSGNLRYTVEDSVGSKIQAGLFGAYANPYAQDYIDSGYKTIDKNNISEMVGLKMNSTEYRDFKEGLSKAGSKKEDKLNYIDSSDLTPSQKNLVANNLDKDSKTKIDMEDYSNYDSYEEYQYAIKNPQKYNTITQIDSYDNYNKYKKDIAEIKEENSTEKGYSTSQRKAAIQSYIDGLDLNIPQKMMLEKEAGGYSIKSYSNYIQEYLDSTNLTESEKYEIWEELFN